MAINKGSNTLIKGEFASVADDTPKNDAIGLAHTPTHAPLLQHDNKIGAADVMPPVRDVHNDFFVSISLKFLFYKIYFLSKKRRLPVKLKQELQPADQLPQQKLVRY